METQIRRCRMQRLIWVCTVCNSFYGSPDYNGLNNVEREVKEQIIIILQNWRQIFVLRWPVSSCDNLVSVFTCGATSEGLVSQQQEKNNQSMWIVTHSSRARRLENLTFATLWANTADGKLKMFFLFFPENSLLHFMQFAWSVKAYFLGE